MKSFAHKKYALKPTPVEPNVIHVPKQQWVDNKRPMFQWAQNEAAKKCYSSNVLNFLKELINCTDQKGVTSVTLETLHNRLISRYGKAAPSRRSLDNYIAILVKGKSIKRSAQIRAKSLITTRLLVGKLVNDSTQELRTEYISNKRYIYRGGVNTKNTASPSTLELSKAPPAPLYGARGASCENKERDRSCGRGALQSLKSQLKEITK